MYHTDIDYCVGMYDTDADVGGDIDMYDRGIHTEIYSRYRRRYRCALCRYVSYRHRHRHRYVLTLREVLHPENSITLSQSKGREIEGLV